ncbi:hypothetical protein HG535_0F01240 [Zygotorulaspora mrakii]|uniref:Uncharacterized protein n=1 Tax=Zygotorulaspora mrakii TaxID=42260 RepID=A0A7H9B568_ZYGMR|nr:uncharacterized protein HG535_0F01240 [Zygotorulaspora mrakii]QLG73613.1 hypothetical protein HG535_0F01240 [Zygotorulaspora mrakii]
MSKRLSFLQDHCLLLTLGLFHRSVSPPNELLWTRNIASELSKICNILYARNTFSYRANSVARHQPTLDLVLSSSNVTRLAKIIFNLRGIKLNENEIETTPILNPVEESIDSVTEYRELDSVYESLKQQWNIASHREGYGKSALQPLISVSSLFFNKRPVEAAYSATNELIPLSRSPGLQSDCVTTNPQTSTFFQVDEFAQNAKQSEFHHPELQQMQKGSNFMLDDAARHFHDYIGQCKKFNHHQYLALTPKLYYNYDSFPVGLKKWLHDIDRLDMSFKDKRAQSDRLDILLHGFKGFG